MKLKQATINKAVIFLIHIFIFSNIFAQTEQDSKLSQQEFNRLKEFRFSIISYDLQPISFDKSTIYNRAATFMEINQFNNKTKKSIIFKNMSFKQSKSENFLPNLGVYEHYNNSFNFIINDNIIVDFGIGLVKQNSILTSNYPNYQFSFHTSVEYAITNWLSAYAYGQYLTSPFNKPKDFFDPLIYMNPLFLQTEIGGGLKAKYKNINADIGVKAMYNTQFKQASPVGTMNSKVTIGF